jgi:hypothetical protein
MEAEGWYSGKIAIRVGRNGRGGRFPVSLTKTRSFWRTEVPLVGELAFGESLAVKPRNLS